MILLFLQKDYLLKSFVYKYDEHPPSRSARASPLAPFALVPRARVSTASRIKSLPTRLFCLINKIHFLIKIVPCRLSAQDDSEGKNAALFDYGTTLAMTARGGS